jgi:hypothetical protein
MVISVPTGAGGVISWLHWRVLTRLAYSKPKSSYTITGTSGGSWAINDDKIVKACCRQFSIVL